MGYCDRDNNAQNVSQMEATHVNDVTNDTDAGYEPIDFYRPSNASADLATTSSEVPHLNLDHIDPIYEVIRSARDSGYETINFELPRDKDHDVTKESLPPKCGVTQNEAVTYAAVKKATPKVRVSTIVLTA